MEKESVKKFDLEAAFKALDEIEIPAIEKGSGRSKANRVDLKERFSHKPTTETLVEDYYDVSSNEDLEEAKEEREGEVAQAKLARIEKIVDLDAETADDLLPSYVGKVIMQCPQCMTLFYKNPEDIEHSEENPDVVNINEVCQHCGNTSGYTLIGKVDSVGSDEADKYEEAPVEETPAEENELDLEFPEEKTSEEPSEEDLDLDLDLDLEEVPEEEPEETNESLNAAETAPSEEESENKSENVTLNEEVEDKELDKKLAAHNEYIDYLRSCIAEKEEALKKAENEEIKALIEKSLEGLKADLEAALPDAVKEEPVEEPAVEEIPTAEEIAEEPVSEEEPVEEKTEEGYTGNPAERTTHLEYTDDDPTDGKAVLPDNIEKQLTEETEEAPECKVVLSDKPEKEVFAGSKEDCEKIIEKNKDTNTAKEHGLEIVEPAVEESLNTSEEAVSENESEEVSENTTLNESLTESAEAEIDAIIASWGDVSEGLTEEGDLDKLLDSKEFKTPVTDKEIEAARKEATEESLEECSKQSLTEEPEDEAKAIVDSWKDGEPVEEDINITNNDSPARVDNRTIDNSNEATKEEPKVEEGILGAVDSVVDGVVGGVKNLLASDEAEKKDLEECNKTEEGLGLFGIGDVNVNLDASGQNNAVGVGGGEGKTEGLIPDGLPTPPGLPGLPGLTEEAEEKAEEEASVEEPVEEPKEEEKVEEPTPIETTVEEVKEVAEVAAEEVVAEVAPEVPIEEVKEVIEDKVEEVVEDKLGEEQPEEEVEAEEEPVEEEQPVEETPDFDFDDLQEESFNTHVKNFLTEVYENVSDFAATSCELKEGKLFVEGKISFKSGNEKLTMFEFLPQYGDGKLFFEGLNKDFSEDKAFTLNCSLTEAKELITESFGYKYKINETLVEGLK